MQRILYIYPLRLWSKKRMLQSMVSIRNYSEAKEYRQRKGRIDVNISSDSKYLVLVDKDDMFHKGDFVYDTLYHLGWRTNSIKEDK